MIDELLDMFCVVVLIYFVISVHIIFAIFLFFYLQYVFHHYGYTKPIVKMWNKLFMEV